MKPPGLFARLCSAAVVVLLLGLVVGFVAYLVLPHEAFENRGRAGCYVGSRLLPYIECRGFFGASLINLFIGVPWGFVFTMYFLIGAPSSFLNPALLERPLATVVAFTPYIAVLVVVIVGMRTWWRLFWSAWRGEDWPGETEAGKSPDAMSQSSSDSDVRR
jgi:hypothetical protein